MRRTTIYLPAVLKRRLESRAAFDRESQSAVVRRALERLLDEPPRSPRLPLGGEPAERPSDGRGEVAGPAEA